MVSASVWVGAVFAQMPVPSQALLRVLCRYSSPCLFSVSERLLLCLLHAEKTGPHPRRGRGGLLRAPGPDSRSLVTRSRSHYADLAPEQRGGPRSLPSVWLLPWFVLGVVCVGSGKQLCLRVPRGHG